ncbi:MAG: hypothetical protein Q7K65_05045 [Candidatus Buchananbacteria bacterium]|nr:hypothetical protein [Candidatus Buchananbacteria bacterium]
MSKNSRPKLHKWGGVDGMKLGEILLDQNLVTKDQLAVAHKLKMTSMSHRKLGEILIRLNFVSKASVKRALAKQLYLEYVASLKTISQSTLNLVDQSITKLYNVIPLREDGDKLVVIALNLTSENDRENLSRLLGREIVFAASDPEVISEFLDNPEFCRPEIEKPYNLRLKINRLESIVEVLEQDIKILNQEVHKLKIILLGLE